MTILAHAGHGSVEMAANSLLHTMTTLTHLPVALSIIFISMVLAFAAKVYTSSNSR